MELFCNYVILYIYLLFIYLFIYNLDIIGFFLVPKAIKLFSITGMIKIKYT